VNVCVLGLWHLGTVTAACLAAYGCRVVGLDRDERNVASLNDGIPPLVEPGLETLVQTGLASGALRFTTDAADALRDSEALWVAVDTPVDDEDRADVEAVVDAVARVLPQLRDGMLVLVSSQVPVGTTRRLEQRFAELAAGRRVDFVYVPENLRLGAAIDAFQHPDRIVAGVRTNAARTKTELLLGRIGAPIEWMAVESAEMTKHALNAFLATSIAFINEVATVCEEVGADAADVSRALKSDARIGPQAYLSAGSAFAGGTLARDVVYLSTAGGEHRLPMHLLTAVGLSNDAHRLWPRRRLAERLGALDGLTIAVWGLTYKSGTSTLRRSAAIGLCEWLHEHGATIRAHDPAVAEAPDGMAGWLELAPTPIDALDGASALVISTPWPQFRAIDAEAILARMRRPLVLDAAGFLAQTLGSDRRVEYLQVGKGTR
jgi:UDPglucose 6-dehydrogenase